MYIEDWEQKVGEKVTASVTFPGYLGTPPDGGDIPGFYLEVGEKEWVQVHTDVHYIHMCIHTIHP